MRRREFLSLAAAPLAAATRPPNILLIMADDLGAKELGCYGNARHRTPHLDRMASTGVQFQTCYATPICHPTRVEILTGQYGHHNGVYNFAGRRGGPEEDSAVEDIGTHHTTFAEVLKTRGYATAIAGKWQLSGRQPDMIRECGFDEYCMWAFPGYVAEKDKPRYRARERYWQPAVIRNGTLLDTTENDYGPHYFTSFIEDFIRRPKQTPFLAYFPMVLTHGPHMATPDSTRSREDKFRADKRKNYQANVEYMDKMVGRLVKAVEDSGQRDNTVVLFTADNGTAGEGKGDGTELGARVPMIVNGAGIRAIGATPELTDLSDILPTLASFAGAALPKGKPIDGRSQAAFLRGTGKAPRDWIYSYIGDRRILRTKRYLLEDNSPRHYGKLYDCGTSRDGTGYQDVTESRSAEVLAVRRRFDAILAKHPVPVVPYDGHPAEKKRSG